MSFLSSLAAPVLSIAGGLFGQSQAQSHADSAAQQQFERQQELMKLQHDYQVADYKHRYQWSAQDMRAAGLNPILAATQGIGGNIAGVSAGAAAQAQTPMQDFSRLGEVFNSARSISQQKEIAKMQNDVALGELEVKRDDVNSAIEKREADTRRENLLADVTKWSIKEQNKRSWEKVRAEIENMKETLRIQEEHLVRSDAAAFISAEAHALSASAAWHSSQVQSRLADIAEKTGYTQQELNKAHEVLVQIQTADAEELKEWHKWLNDHKELRGAVGLVGSMWDTYTTAKKVEVMSNAVD